MGTKASAIKAPRASLEPTMALAWPQDRRVVYCWYRRVGSAGVSVRVRGDVGPAPSGVLPLLCVATVQLVVLDRSRALGQPAWALEAEAALKI